MAKQKKAVESRKPEFEKRAEKRRFARQMGLLLLAFVLVLSCTSQGRRFWAQMFRLSKLGGEVDAPLNIHVLDVGKADAILIECNGHAALLDAGTEDYGETIIDYMARRNIASLDYAIVSHPDKDHLGGMAQVLSEVPTQAFVRSCYFEEKYDDTRKAAREKPVSEQIVSPGDTLALGQATLRILAPLTEYGDTNNASLVIRLEYPGFTALFCGDIEEEAENDLVDKVTPLLSADLLKVPHHGSKSSCTDHFLQAVSPRYAVISVGNDNNKLPSEKTLRKLDDCCEKVYRTDIDGTVTFSFTGTELQVFTGQS